MKKLRVETQSDGQILWNCKQFFGGSIEKELDKEKEEL